MLNPESAFYFKYFQILETLSVNVKADQGADLLPSLQACGSGIDEKHVHLAVMLDFQYVGVAAYEEVRSLVKKLLAYAVVIVVGAASYVLEHDFGLFHTKTVYLLEGAADILSVTVAPYGAQWRNLFQLLCNDVRAHIAGMPDLIATVQEVGIAVIPIAVGVGQNAYPFHFAKRKINQVRTYCGPGLL